MAVGALTRLKALKGSMARAIGCLVAFLTWSSAVAGDRYVSRTGGNNPPYESWTDAATSLPTVRLLTGHTVVGVSLDDDGRVTGVDTTSRNGDRLAVEAAGVFGALPPVPNSEPFAELTELDPERRLAVDTDFAVAGAPPGLFAAGDVRAGAPHRAATAAGDGTAAAVAITSFLGTHR